MSGVCWVIDIRGVVANRVSTCFQQKWGQVGYRKKWNEREWGVMFWNKFLLLQLKNIDD
jgi:hypothetical protein